MNIKLKLKQAMDSKNVIIKGIFIFLYKIYSSDIIYNLRFRSYMSDEKYIKYLYKKRFGKKINLDNPKTFNEKNNWRKLYDRNPKYTNMVDKYKFKEYVKNKVGEDYVIPLIGVYDNSDQIQLETLPDKFVLKVNHAGGIIVCRDKNKFDFQKANKELKRELKMDYYIRSREWPYKNVERKIICEKYMGEDLMDFKNYCFGGKLMYTFVWENKSREDGRKPEPIFCGSYDRKWNKKDFKIGYKSKVKEIKKPECYEEMIKIAERLSENIPFVRVDCYIIDNKLYAGEMTFFPWGGFMKFEDEKDNEYLGDLEKLPMKK